MTVQTNTTVATGIGNDVATVFPVGFKFNRDADLVVSVMDNATAVEALMTLNSDYTVQGAGTEGGGSVTLTTALASGKTLVAKRVVDVLQMTDLRNQGKFFAEVHESALDLLTMIAQQHETEIGQTLRVAETDPKPERIPPVSQRAGKLLAFDENGNPTTTLPINDSSTELRQELAEPGGAARIGYKERTVGDELERLNDESVAQTSPNGAALIPTGPTADRPAEPLSGMFRGNEETGQYEGFLGGEWKPVGESEAGYLTSIPDTFINGTPLSKFGDMTLGEGLAGLFDTRIFQGARREATTGYAGLTLPSAASIDFVEVVSGTNGFDGSGGANNATVQLYAKDGAAPTSSTDGVLLGSATVTDNNTQKTVTITSSSSTPYTHVWVRISTSVWAVAVEIRIFKRRPQLDVVGAGSTVLLSACNQNVALTSGGREIPQFRIPVLLDKPRVVLLDFHCDVIHTGLGDTGAIAVGYSFGLLYRSGTTEAEMLQAGFTRVFNAIGGGNVSEINPQHYGNKSLTSALMLPAGYHEISVIGSGHTDGSAVPGILQVLAEAGQGLNALRVTVLP